MANGVRLEWNGRQEARATAAPPALRCVEAYGAGRNRLLLGDNLAAMSALRETLRGQVRLLYLDPPFFTGAEWGVRAEEGRAGFLSAFSDDWGGDLGAYLQWMLERLTLARELLAEDGSLYVHLGWRAAHYVKLLLDEIFGAERFQNEIIWCYREAINAKKRWNRKHDTVLFYSKGEKFTFNYEAVRERYAESHIKKYRLHDEKGAYRLMGRGIVGSPLRSKRDIPPEYETLYPGLTYRHYLGHGTLPVDYWQIDIENQASAARTGYPTQKPEALLERILLASSNPGDLVADFCCGSGTTLVMATRLGRRWIGCDVGALAVHTTRKRLLEMPNGADFTVERVEPFEAAAFAPLAEGNVAQAVQVESVARGAQLRLTPEAAEGVDMWAVQWRAEEDAPFRPDWWSARTRRTPTLSDRSAVFPTAAAEGGRARVVLTDRMGNETAFPLPWGSEKKI